MRRSELKTERFGTFIRNYEFFHLRVARGWLGKSKHIHTYAHIHTCTTLGGSVAWGGLGLL